MTDITLNDENGEIVQFQEGKFYAKVEFSGKIYVFTNKEDYEVFRKAFFSMMKAIEQDTITHKDSK